MASAARTASWLLAPTSKPPRVNAADGPGGGAGVPPSDEHPKGLAAIYRLIPAWPRRLAIIQLCTVYAFTGIVKNGSVWAKGDAIYYAWNMDHFYRFYPQWISAHFGTNVLRLMTWMAHWGEAFFWISIIGIFVFWARSERIPPTTGLRRTLTRLCWSALILVSGGLILRTWPVHFTPVLSWAALAMTVGIIAAVVMAMAGMPVLLFASLRANTDAVRENWGRPAKDAPVSQPPRVASVIQFKKRGGNS